MNIIRIETTNSTNTWVAEHEPSVSSPSLIYCISQTAGRGQRGNHWESEPGKNITASLVFHPENFPANEQFKISEAVAIALVEYLQEKGVEAKVKVHTALAKQVLVVPIEVINSDKDGDFVYAVENNILMKKRVVRGISSDTYCEIKEGLHEGDQIVSTISGDLEEGMAVTPMPME